MRTKQLLMMLAATFTLTGVVHANLLTNGDFNTTLGSEWTVTNESGWVNQEIPSVNSTTMGIYDGTLQMTMGDFSETGYRGMYQTVPGIAGEEYSLSIESGVQDWWWPEGFAYLKFLDAGGFALAIYSIEVTADITDFDVGVPYSSYSVSETAPVGTTQVRVELAELNASGSIWFDNIDLRITTDDDGDGLPNAWEIDNGLDPLDDGTINIINGAIGDPDVDLLVNSNEYAYGTDPWDPDTDDDGLTDYFEVTFSNAPNPAIWDTDGDGLGDGAEVTNHLTNPLLVDTDGDGLWDFDEVSVVLTDPLLVDTDGDSENDRLEVFQGTDPTNTASSSTAFGWVVVDGMLDTGYGDAVSTQTVNTAWEDNLDELNAAYARIQNGKLYLMITGNMNPNWNSIEIFIDSSSAVTTNVLDAAGNDNTDNMDGLVFDSGFSPDYHLNIRLGEFSGAYNFNVDFSDLANKTTSYHGNLFEGLDGGIGYMGSGDASSNSIAFAFTNSNAEGVVAGISAANQADALAVSTGLELAISMSDLDNPYANIRIATMVTTSAHSQLSNQILSGVPAPQDELGATSNVNFTAFSGDQFFSVFTRALPDPTIASIQLLSGDTTVQFSVDGLIAGYDYLVQDSDNLVHGGFSDVAGTTFTAGSTNETIVLPADTDVNPVLFYRLTAPVQ